MNDQMDIKNYADSLFPTLLGYRPEDINRAISELKKSPNFGRLDIRGTMGLPNAVAKFDQWTFDDQSVLVLEAIDAPFIAIGVKELLLDIRNPQYRAFISRIGGKKEADVVDKLIGANGAKGFNGANGDGERNREGNPGQDGQNGGSGGKGGTKYLPEVFIFVQRILFGTGATPSKQYLNLYFRGLRGGDGGMGGRGGNGGNGAPGKEGADGLFDCKAGPGRGGNGGNAGRGGSGGDGGNGGDGGILHLAAPDAAVFNFTTTDIEAGRGGVGGLVGSNGTPGTHGRGGPANGHCMNGPDGSDGGVLVGAQGPGNDGRLGNRGMLFTISRDNSDIFGP